MSQWEVLLGSDPSALRCKARVSRTARAASPPGLAHPSPKPGREPQPHLSMLMAQRFRMLAVHIITSRVTKTSQQRRLKFQTPPVTWASETRMLVFLPQQRDTTPSTPCLPWAAPTDADRPSLLEHHHYPGRADSKGATGCPRSVTVKRGRHHRTLEG